MKIFNLHITIKILLYWYIFIFISTEFLSAFRLLERNNIFFGEIFFWIGMVFFYRHEIKQELQRVNVRSKIFLFISFLFLLTFIQGFFSAPSTTDSMVYHIPRIMYWIQEKTMQQDIIRNPHDFMAPFAEYILLHLYFIAGGDRLLFFSQWIAFVTLVISSGLIAEKIGADKNTKTAILLLVATLPMVVMQSSSTQVDLVVTILIIISTYISLILLEQITLKNSVLFGLTLGLGISTKATFYPFIVVPLGILLVAMAKQKNIVLIFLSGLIAIVMPLRYMFQNFHLYGNILGPLKKGSMSTLTNDSFNLVTVVSNLIRNIMMHLPIPFFTIQAQNFLELIHKVIGVTISSASTTCCGFEFKVLPVIYPQEDIVSNPLHLLLILTTLIFIFKTKESRYKIATLVYFLTIFSLIIFSLILKWQPFHSRVQMPFFALGVIASVIILSGFRKGSFIIKAVLRFSIPIALFLILFNISRAYISYSFFYNSVKSFAPPLSSMPESFLVKPRDQQYFNSRFYWYEPYLQLTSIIPSGNSNRTIAFSLMDDFEYPLWVFMQKNNKKGKIIPYSRIFDDTLIISTTEEPVKREGYLTNCIKTEIDYGYACVLSRY